MEIDQNEAPDGVDDRHEDGVRVASLTAQLRTALEERNDYWAEAQRARALELELAHTRKIIADMKRSPSWRLTAPLRRAKGGVGAVRQPVSRVRKALRGR